ncbi:MAG: hypothetical protein IKS60_07195 [Lachnospiraceae bacterium]|nr:hypothetical protein [Lachnospiraceae bacterium]MBP5494396.1 hypothetical protein [Lachnospiraceae bacterium]MBR4413383.1 hypothetical protein [Lachnospiraceae bacterium]MBR5916470.1 hypothetical protein [Lachnospiraceae bacterium]
MKKTTKGFLLGLTTAAACVGAYYVYQNRDKIFKTEEIINEDGTVTKKRSYVDLDNIKEKTNEAVSKTKETAQNTWKKAQDKIDGLKKKKGDDSVAEEIKDAAEDIKETVEDAVEDIVEEVKED